MSCICSTALAGRPGELGVLTAIGADSAPGAHRGSGRPATARSPTAAIAAKRTMASVMFGVIKFFITHFLSYGLRSPQSCLVVVIAHSLPGTYDAMDSEGGRVTDEPSPAPYALWRTGPASEAPDVRARSYCQDLWIKIF